MHQQVNRFVNVTALKHYFNVSNSYVINKLFLVLFPWRHKPWSRKHAGGPNGQDGWYLPPRDDINSPDMYIPGLSTFYAMVLVSIANAVSSHVDCNLYPPIDSSRRPPRAVPARALGHHRVEGPDIGDSRDHRAQDRVLLP